MSRRNCPMCADSYSGVCDGECYRLKDPDYIPTQETTPTVPTARHNPAPALLTLTEDSAARKDTPMARGVLDYFPAALAYVAQVSAHGNAKHNPDSEELVWTRSKSYDHADCILRHLADRGLSDDAGIRHSGYVAWRALALLQTELEAEGASPGRASVFDAAPTPYRVDCRGGVLTADMKRDAPDHAEFFGYSRDCTVNPCQPHCCTDAAEPVGAGVSKPHPICGLNGRPCPLLRGCSTPCPGR